jgi:hypothetical protein
LKDLKNLECLSLNDTVLDAAALEQLSRFRNLQWLSLVNTAVRDRELAEANLRSALPNCAIFM